MESKKDLVHSLFQVPDWYLKRTHNIRIRKETIQEFLKDESFTEFLDIGCGDGSLSLPLLTAQRHLTLVDLSEGMLSVAQSKIPKDLIDHVKIFNMDAMAADLAPQAYDAIFCVGVLAHVDSPEALLNKIISLLKPGGILILEQTEARHFMTLFTNFLDDMRRLFAPESYKRNQVLSSELLGFLAKRGFDLKATYRYSLPLPGMHRVANQETLYRMIRLVFGAYPAARLSYCGNECLYFLKLKPRHSESEDLLQPQQRQALLISR
jgi:2-polyprenyl-3-methyl-5-hydroxy-6-metoxy-1,4-benzoquinol methylase